MLIASMATIGIAVIVFASTNIDDILLLAAFFADPKIRARNIVIGQYLGLGILFTVSAVAAMASVLVPEGWSGLLGIVPLSLGIKSLFELCKKGHDDEIKVQESEHRIEGRFHSQMLAVSMITVANGGDNLGVYIPLFAKDTAFIPLIGFVFLFMTAVWCLAGYFLVNNPLFGHHVQHYGRIALPFVLAGLGVFILSDSLVLRWLGNKFALYLIS